MAELRSSTEIDLRGRLKLCPAQSTRRRRRRADTGGFQTVVGLVGDDQGVV